MQKNEKHSKTNEKHSKTIEIALGEDFGNVAVSVNGVSIKVRTDGSVLAYTDGPVNVRPADNDNAMLKVARAPEIGDRMEDGTIFAGLSPEANQPMYVMPEDAPLTMYWKWAMHYAPGVFAHGHQDWRVPTKGELNVLFQNRAKIGGFETAHYHHSGWYWSSTEHGNSDAHGQRFSDGFRRPHGMDNYSSVRLVRS